MKLLVPPLVLAFGCGNSNGHEATPDAQNLTPVDASRTDAPVVDAQAATDAAIADARDTTDAGLADASPYTCDSPQTLQYVLTRLTVPESPGQAHAFSLDLDGDSKPDNALGSMLGNLGTTVRLDLGDHVDEQIARGHLLQLFSLSTSSVITSTCATLTTYVGADPSPEPCTDASNLATCRQHLAGTGLFSVADGSIQGGALAARIKRNDLLAQNNDQSAMGFVFLSIVGGPAEAIPLRSPTIFVRTKAFELQSGILAGGISESDVTNRLMPALTTFLQSQVAVDCEPEGQTCNCTAGSKGAEYLGFFDSNSDCQITLPEVLTNALVYATLQKPDLDLLDADGLPGTDGHNEHFSIGFDFAAIQATFVAP